MQFVWNQNLEDLPIEQVQSTRTMQWRRYAKVIVEQKDNGDVRKVTQF
jgi:hypothetical protein